MTTQHTVKHTHI